jgi:hypothetical protein
VLPAGTALFVLLDLYTTHFLLLPYYTGLIAHRADGALAAFHLSQLGNGGFSVMMSRLMLPAPAAVALWVGFLIATLALPVLAFRTTGCATIEASLWTRTHPSNTKDGSART